ncbi:MAG: IS200/IS605 family element transposase accessory protein TnpB, partial [Desulfovibrio sp.]|nr:IS200/IS605 family element transposase accessory protein TnpB [Desulfovibrio sp.]
WYVSIQTERVVAEPVHQSLSEVGIDLGVAHFASLSDGSYLAPLNTFRKYSGKLARLQRQLAKKAKFSSNWKKIKFRIQKLHRKLADIRHDFLHKATSTISKSHALVVVEDLQVKNMSSSASGTMENPGRNVKAKSGLNKSILDQGWGEFARQLEYKLGWLGGCLIRIAPQYTSQRCSQCGHISKENRKTQAKFKCMACGFEANADHNAALNILAAGHVVSACGAERARASALKQEPAYDAAL